jgi:hypothetical protein
MLLQERAALALMRGGKGLENRRKGQLASPALVAQATLDS